MAKMPHSGEYAEILRSLQRQLKAAELEIANQKWLINELLKSPSWRLTYRHSFRTRSGWRLHAPPPPAFQGRIDLDPKLGDLAVNDVGNLTEGVGPPVESARHQTKDEQLPVAVCAG